MTEQSCSAESKYACAFCGGPLPCLTHNVHAPAQTAPQLPPLVDRAELIALLQDLASVNLHHEAVERQARRMADDLIARGLTFAAQPPAAPVETGGMSWPEQSKPVVTLTAHSGCSADSWAVPEREAFWLLEMVGHQKYALYTSQRNAFVHSWTEDVWQAGRFRDERDAHEAWRMLEKAERERWKPVEHMFINKVTRDEPQTAPAHKDAE